MLPPPLSVRRGIPFYHDKTESEFSADVYERYDELVMRQAALHLADPLHGGYPHQPILDWLLEWLPEGDELTVADLGCSVGRLTAEVAARRPGWDCYGFDLSYQMLRLARDHWVLGQETELHLLRYGLGSHRVSATPRPNLRFGLARAERLPFPDDSLDLVWNSFLLDRVPDPTAALKEWHRILRPAARMLVVTPLNFLDPGQWRKHHPPVKLLHGLERSGWRVLDWQDPREVREPLDARGNAVLWQTLRFVAEKVV